MVNSLLVYIVVYTCFFFFSFRLHSLLESRDLVLLFTSISLLARDVWDTEDFDIMKPIKK